ncbi:MAG: hypothetical protein ACXW3D_07800, partial [Caulobacteraceae bacterium]
MSSSAATTPLKLRRRLLHGASAVVFLATLGGGGAHAQSAAGLRAAAGIGTAAAMARPKPTPTGPNIQGMNSASA